MKVLVVCEDPTHDQYIVKPVVEHIYQEIGRRAQVEVLRDPHLRGIDHLVDELPAILEDYKGVVRMFVVIADRDGSRHPEKLARLKRAAAKDQRAVVCFAIEEVEVWLLALHRDQLDDWQRIRSDPDVKDNHALPFLEHHDFGGPGHGRKAAMRAAPAPRWRGLLQICDELAALKDAVRAALDAAD